MDDEWDWKVRWMVDCGIISVAQGATVLTLLTHPETPQDADIINIMIFAKFNYLDGFEELNRIAADKLMHTSPFHSKAAELLHYRLISWDEHVALRYVQSVILHNVKRVDKKYLICLQKNRFGLIRYCNFETAPQIAPFLLGG
jgi:hypothetical protein